MEIKVTTFKPNESLRNSRYALTDLTYAQLLSICQYIEFIRKLRPDGIFKEDKKKTVN